MQQKNPSVQTRCWLAAFLLCDMLIGFLRSKHLGWMKQYDTSQWSLGFMYHHSCQCTIYYLFSTQHNTLSTSSPLGTYFYYFPLMHLSTRRLNCDLEKMQITWNCSYFDVEWLRMCKKYLGVGEMNELHGRLLALSARSLWTFYFL